MGVLLQAERWMSIVRHISDIVYIYDMLYIVFQYGDKKLCGYSRPLDMESTTNIVIVEFSSNYDFEELGFSLSWTAVGTVGLPVQ